MDNIKDIVAQVIHDAAEKRSSPWGEIEKTWRASADRKTLAHTKIVGFKDGRLSIEVDSPAWLYQLRIVKNRLLEKMRQQNPDIRDVFFRVGTVK